MNKGPDFLPSAEPMKSLFFNRINILTRNEILGFVEQLITLAVASGKHVRLNLIRAHHNKYFRCNIKFFDRNTLNGLPEPRYYLPCGGDWHRTGSSDKILL